MRRENNRGIYDLEQEKNLLEMDKVAAEDECKEIKTNIHKAKIANICALTLFMCSALAGGILPNFSDFVKQGVIVFAIGGIISLILFLYASQTPYNESKREITEITDAIQTSEKNFNDKKQAFENGLIDKMDMITVNETQKENETNFTKLAEQYLSFSETELANSIFIRYCVRKGYDYQEFTNKNEELEVLRKKMYEALCMTGDNGKKAAEQLARKFGWLYSEESN